MPTPDSAASLSGTNVSSLTFAHTCSGSDRSIFVGAGWSTGPEAMALISTITYAGAGLTSIWNFIDQPTDHGNAGFYLIAPATGANNVVTTWAATMDEVVSGSISMTGVHQTTAIGTAATANGTSATPSVNVSSASDELVVDNVYYGHTASATAGAGQTKQWERLNIGTYSSGTGSTETGAATTTMSWTITSAPWNIGAVPFKPVGASTAKAPPPRRRFPRALLAR